MKPAPFEYLAPRTVPEAVSLLARHGEEAKLLAGGQSLVPLMNMRLARPRRVIDLNRTQGLAYIREVNGALRIGGMTRQATLERSPVIGGRCPLLPEALALVGHPAIRSRGTIGGSLAHAGPAAELAAALAALGGQVPGTGPPAERTAPVRVARAEALVSGRRPDAAVFAAVEGLVRETLQPDGDLHASADYRREVAGVVARRALTTAWSRTNHG